MKRYNNNLNGNTRTILFVLCAILMVLCFLIFPWFCSSIERSTSPLPEPVPTPLPNPNDNFYQSCHVDTGTNDMKPKSTEYNYYNKENQEPLDSEERYSGNTKPDPSVPGYYMSEDPSVDPTNCGDAGEFEDEIKPINSIEENPDDGETELLYPAEDNTQEYNNLQPTNSDDEQSNKNLGETDSEVTTELPASEDYNPTEPTSEIHQNVIDPYWSMPTRYPNSNQIWLIVLLIVLILLLICYIIARVKLKHGTLVITVNMLDKILIILSPILFFIAWCIGFDHELSEAQIILLSLSGIMLIVSIIFSVLANVGNLWNIILSVMAKLFIFVFTNILLLLLIVILVFSIMHTLMRHNNHEGTYIVKYDHFLDQCVGYKID